MSNDIYLENYDELVLKKIKKENLVFDIGKRSIDEKVNIRIVVNGKIKKEKGFIKLKEKLLGKCKKEIIVEFFKKFK